MVSKVCSWSEEVVVIRWRLVVKDHLLRGGLVIDLCLSLFSFHMIVWILIALVGLMMLLLSSWSLMLRELTRESMSLVVFLDSEVRRLVKKGCLSFFVTKNSMRWMWVGSIDGVSTVSSSLSLVSSVC